MLWGAKFLSVTCTVWVPVSRNTFLKVSQVPISLFQEVLSKPAAGVLQVAQGILGLKLWRPPGPQSWYPIPGRRPSKQISSADQYDISFQDHLSFQDGADSYCLYWQKSLGVCLGHCLPSRQTWGKNHPFGSRSRMFRGQVQESATGLGQVI